jgi:tRNA(adenine34) deaminase
MQDAYRPSARLADGPPIGGAREAARVNYELFMAEAIAEARRGAEAGEAPIGSVLVIDDAMIARDHDHSALSEDPTAHAVLLTLQAAARKLGTRRLAEATIFTTHEPCAMCVGALVESRVRALVFAVADPERGAAGSVVQLARNPSLPHQISVVSGVRESEARRLASEFASV